MNMSFPQLYFFFRTKAFTRGTLWSTVSFTDGTSLRLDSLNRIRRNLDSLLWREKRKHSKEFPQVPLLLDNESTHLGQLFKLFSSHRCHQSPP